MSTAATTALAPDLLVIGGTGLLGRHVVSGATTLGLSHHATHHTTAPPTREDWHSVDLRDGGERVAELIARLRPRAVINAAAVQDGPDLEAITAQAPGAIAAASAAVGARLVHLSSDVVFDGERSEPYTEHDPTAPVHDYGRAKLAAETLVARHDPAAVVVRTSLLWSDDANRPDRQVRLVADPAVRFFTDEIRCPLRVDRLAAACLDLAERREITGPLHVAGGDAVDRLTFARALAPLAGRDPGDLMGGPSDQDGTRPLRLALDSSLARSLLATPLPGIGTDAPTGPFEPG